MIGGQFRIEISVLSFAMGLSIFGCGAKPENEAAQLVNALATKVDLNLLVSGKATLPDEISCGKSAFQIKRATSTTSSGVTLGNLPSAGTTGEITLAIKLNVSGSALFQNTDGTDSFNCSIKVRYARNAVGDHLTGTGDLATCDGFDCVANSSAITCEKMKSLLAASPCE